MSQLTPNEAHIAYCGLYCGACRKLRSGSCPGCHENAKASWCQVRTCCIEHGYGSCADCGEHTDPRECRKFNNVIAKVFGLVFNSDRKACIYKIRELGRRDYAAFMATRKLQTLPRRGQQPS